MAVESNNHRKQNVFLNGLAVGFKSVDWLARKVHRIQDKIMIPLVTKYWPRKITPNMVTSLRIVMGLVIFFLVLTNYLQYRITIIILFAIASLLDFIDGPIARALNKVTRLGGALDPLSDRVLICPTLAVLLWNFSHRLVIFIIAMELIVFVMAGAVFFKKNVEFKANIWGKWKMCFQVFGLILVFFNKIAWGISFLWISVGLSLASVLGHLHPAIVYIFKPASKK